MYRLPIFLRRNFLSTPLVTKHAVWRKRALLLLALLPMALSPTHPIAVYAYLANVYVPALTRPAYADTEYGLEDFLVSPEQVERYRESLVTDMSNRRGGEIFAVVQANDGRLMHAPLRTWNHFLPTRLPEPLRAWLDRKEFPYLADEVELWLDGFTIVAMGHFHAFGGPPSPGDRLAHSFGSVPEVVVTNGIIPLVYLQGELLPYANDVEIAPDVFRSMRTLTPSLTMAVEYISPIDKEPSPALIAVLGKLRDDHKIDIASRQSVATEVLELCRRFREEYRFAFEGGYIPLLHMDKPDHIRMIYNLAAIQAWAELYAVRPVGAV